MKPLIFSLLFSLFTLAGYGQTFYVEPTEKGFEKYIIEKLRTDGYELIEEKDSADYIVKLFLSRSDKVASIFQGYITLEDNTGNSFMKSTDYKTTATISNGYNAAKHIFTKIYDKQIPKMIANIESN